MIGVIIIGRNEGPRLLACLESVRTSTGVSVADIVYVDSHSTDNSLEIATRYAHVVLLDSASPFTAARARNAGASALLARHPEVTYLQFLDGDTTLDPAWLKHAADSLDTHPDIAVVCGRRRERAPQASVYNRLADMEWDTPIGPAPEFGGDALIRAEAFQQLGGYSAHFIAGEEPEFAARLRLAGHQLVRLNHEMTQHDLAMTTLAQWWRRNVRSGHALAQLTHTHGHAPLYLYRKQWRSTLFWTLIVPLLPCILVLTFRSPWCFLLLPLAYTTLAGRIFRYRRRRGNDRRSAALYAFFTTLGKFPQLLGMWTFYRNLWRNRPSTLIEYKPSSISPTPATSGNPDPAAIGTT